LYGAASTALVESGGDLASISDEEAEPKSEVPRIFATAFGRQVVLDR